MIVNEITILRQFFESIMTFDDTVHERPTERLSFTKQPSEHSDIGETFTSKTDKQQKEDASIKDFWMALRKLGDGNLSVKNAGALPPEVLFSQYVTVQFAKRAFTKLGAIAVRGLGLSTGRQFDLNL